MTTRSTSWEVEKTHNLWSGDESDNSVGGWGQPTVCPTRSNTISKFKSSEGAWGKITNEDSDSSEGGWRQNTVSDLKLKSQERNHIDVSSSESSITGLVYESSEEGSDNFDEISSSFRNLNLK